MTRAQKIEALSPRARKLWDRLCEGAFYKLHDERTPKAMAELEAAGLLMRLVRAPELWACYAPKGSKPYRPEVIAK